MCRRWILFLLPSLTASLLLGQPPAQRRGLVQESEAWMEGPLLDHIPRWNGSLLVTCDHCGSGAPILITADPKGRREEIVFELPGAGFISVRDVASGPDRALVVVGHVLNNSPQFAPFIAWISPDRKRQIVTQVWPYFAHAATVAPDGTIWTVGVVKHDDSMFNLHTNVLRHYEPSGRLLATLTVPHTRNYNGLSDVSDGSSLMASSDRIGWLTHACDYIEFSFSTVEMGRYACPNGIANSQLVGGVGLSSANDLVIAGGRHRPFAPVELNRATGNWDPVAAPADAFGAYGMLGFHGLTLVAWPEVGKMRRFNWDEAPPAGQ